MAAKFWRWYEKANAVVRTFTGPAQLGDGRPEADVQWSSRACPLCGVPMSEHRIERSADQHTATRLLCPA